MSSGSPIAAGELLRLGQERLPAGPVVVEAEVGGERRQDPGAAGVVGVDQREGVLAQLDEAGLRSGRR